MRKLSNHFMIVTGVALTLASVPAYALGMGDLAKVILGNSSVLKKADQKCGSSMALSQQETSIIDVARAAAAKALPATQFTQLASSADTQATTAAQSATFCQETQPKKKGLLSKIGSAGKKLIARQVLGI